MSWDNIKRTSFTEANYQTAIRLDIGCSATAAAASLWSICVVVQTKMDSLMYPIGILKKIET